MKRSSNNADAVCLYRHIGMRVRLCRVYLQLSQQEVADRVKIGAEFLNQIETGRLRAPAYILARYAKLARVPVTWFFDADIVGGGSGQPIDNSSSTTNVIPLKKAASPVAQKISDKRAA